MHQPWQDWFHCNGTLKGNWLRGDQRGWRSRDYREHVDGDYRNPPPLNAHASERQHSINLMTEIPVVLESIEERAEVCRILGGALLFYGVEVAELAVTARHYHVLTRFAAAEEKHRAAAEKAAKDDPEMMRDDAEGAHAQGVTVPATGVAGLPGVAGLCAAHFLKDGRNPLPRYLLGKCHSWTTREFKKWLAAQSLSAQSPGTPVPGTGLFAPRPHCKPIADETHWFNARQYIHDHRLQGGAIWSILIGPPWK